MSVLFIRTVLSAAFVISLVACGSSQQIGAPRAMPQSRAEHGSKTFNYSGSAQYFKVPRGVTQLTVTASGASGPYGATGSYCTVIGGLGGLLQATIPVTPGETLAVFVGGEGTIGAACGSKYGNGSGGFNGAGDVGPAGYGAYGAGGGGASDVREGSTALSDRILVAGGGGGRGGEDGSPGGGGGGGSLYVEPGAINVKDKKGGASPGNGQVVIAW